VTWRDMPTQVTMGPTGRKRTQRPPLQIQLVTTDEWAEIKARLDEVEERLETLEKSWVKSRAKDRVAAARCHPT
jgi:5-bromo-4-chloroindolyl phosphate hydrolysis protein